jgi:gamma-glutamyltranspeptidase/glutathione hydrolase
MVQADLAASLQFLADEDSAARAKAGGAGAEAARVAGLRAVRHAFYRGDIAQRILAYHHENEGLLRAPDLADFRAGVEPAVSIELDGLTVQACGPWCQGPMLLQALMLLDLPGLRALRHNSSAYLHQLVEAVKVAAADREAFYTDPAHTEVPLERLLSPGYARDRRQLIDPLRAWPGMPPAGGPFAAPSPTLAPSADQSAYDTSYCCVVDRWGNAFSATPSDGMTESPIIPGTGLVISPRGSQSRADPTHPAAVGPGRRPRLTPNPALAILPDGRVMPFGTPGGDVQVQAMLQCLLNVAVFGMDVQEAVEAPRFASYSFPSSFAPNDYLPGVLRLEGRVDVLVGEKLAALGHTVEWWPEFSGAAGSVCMVLAGGPDRLRSGAADPRRSAYALGR